MQCIILAGGLGTRMSHLTYNKIPKCLITIKDIPFIDYQLQWLSSHGVKDIILCVSHLKEHIQNYVKDGYKWGLSVKYVDDGYSPLGTGGALRKALDNNNLEDYFMVMYGDSFLPIDFSSIYNYAIQQSFDALMVVYKNNNNFDKSNANFNNGFVEYNKFNYNNNYKYIDYGLSILNKKIISSLIPPNTKYNLADMFLQISQNKNLRGLEVYERFYEIGSPAGLNDFKFWIENNAQFNNT